MVAINSMLKKIKNLVGTANLFVVYWMGLYICHRLFVNLSAFVLVGSHLVLSTTKAESILGVNDFILNKKTQTDSKIN